MVITIIICVKLIFPHCYKYNILPTYTHSSMCIFTIHNNATELAQNPICLHPNVLPGASLHNLGSPYHLCAKSKTTSAKHHTQTWGKPPLTNLTSCPASNEDIGMCIVLGNLGVVVERNHRHAIVQILVGFLAKECFSESFYDGKLFGHSSINFQCNDKRTLPWIQGARSTNSWEISCNKERALAMTP